MPVLSQAPGLPAQNLGNQFIGGLDASRSLMDRADANSRANAQAQRQQELYDVTAPLRAVTQEAEMAGQKAQIESYGIAQEAMIQAQSLVPKATRDFTFMASIEDSQERADYAIEALSRYSQLANVPALKQQFDAFNHAATMAVQDNMKVQMLKKANGTASYQSVNIPLPDGSTQTAVFNRRTGQYEMPNVNGGQQAAPAVAPAPAGGEAISPAAATPAPAVATPAPAASQSQLGRSQTPGAKKAQEATAEGDAKYQQKLIQEKPKRTAALRQAEVSAERMTEDIDELIGKVSAATAGAGGTLMDKFPGTSARDLQQNLDTIKANIGFQTLQAMREASPTGGALGSVSDTEGKLLQAVLGNLTIGQSPKQLVDNLNKVKRRLNENYGITRAAYSQEYGEDVAGSLGDGVAGPSGAPAAPAANDPSPQMVGKYKIIGAR